MNFSLRKRRDVERTKRLAVFFVSSKTFARWVLTIGVCIFLLHNELFSSWTPVFSMVSWWVLFIKTMERHHWWVRCKSYRWFMKGSVWKHGDTWTFGHSEASYTQTDRLETKLGFRSIHNFHGFNCTYLICMTLSRFLLLLIMPTQYALQFNWWGMGNFAAAHPFCRGNYIFTIQCALKWTKKKKKKENNWSVGLFLQ